MTRWIIGGALYAGALFVTAFGIVLAADQRLGVPAPYSMLVAPVALISIAAMLLLLRDWRPTRAAVVPFRRDPTPPVRIDPSVGPPHARRRAVHVAEGFVLLEVPSFGADNRKAA